MSGQGISRSGPRWLVEIETARKVEADLYRPGECLLDENDLERFIKIANNRWHVKDKDGFELICSGCGKVSYPEFDLDAMEELGEWNCDITCPYSDEWRKDDE